MRITLFSFLVLAINLSAQSGWIKQDTEVNFEQESICFVSPMKGWIAGYESIVNQESIGIVLKTLNGGQSWFNPTNHSFDPIRGITFKNDNLGWIISNNHIFHSQDAGETWIEQYSIGDNQHSNLSAIFFINESVGWVTGSREIGEDEHIGIILSTVNGGLNWDEQEIAQVFFLRALYFIDEKLGWITGSDLEGERLLTTINGGINWGIQDIVNVDQINAIFFVDNHTGWIVGYPNRVLKTIDGGNEWIMQAGVSGILGSCYFFTQNIGWIAGTDIWYTKNGGKNWVKQDDLNTGGHLGISFTDSLLGWITTGNNGTILNTNNAGLKPLLQLSYPNGGEKYIVAQTKNIGWQSNDIDSITIEYSTNNGINWMGIAENIPTANENYAWLIQNIPSSECLVKIYNINDPSNFDISDGNFLISRNPRIVSPNGGENLYFEQIYEIQWINGGSKNIKIELSRDYGNSWEIIADSTSALSGHLSWIITPPKSNQSLLKITDNDFPDFFDISDATFRIDTLITPNHDFPLAPGNKWFFKEYDETILTILSASKDTILNDGLNYTQISTYFRQTRSDTFRLGGNQYYRQSGDSVIAYPDRIILNFNWQLGDTIITDSVNYFYLNVYNIRNENVFGRNLITYYIYMTQFEYYSCTDGIGFNTFNASDWYNYYPRYLAGCIIDGIQYGNTSFATTIDHNTTFIPSDISLYQNYPNPFNSKTKIKFDLMKHDHVLVEVYNTAGQRIITLMNEEVPAGSHILEFDGENLSSGVYLYRLKTSQYSNMKKMIYLK